MKANVTISQIYWNKGLSYFFFRDQACKKLDELVNGSQESGQTVLDKLDDLTEDEDINDVEENFYGEDVHTLAEMYDIELEEEEDEEDDEE